LASDSLSSDHTQNAIARINAKLPDEFQIGANLEDISTQKCLTVRVERKSLDAALLSPDNSISLKAHLQLVSAQGAGSWLNGFPSREDETRMDAPLFRIAVKRRLRMQLLATPSFCPACGEGMDIFGDHALVCMCQGDRTLRHNAVRNCANRFLKAAALNPVKETTGLLPPRLDVDTIRETLGSRGRRPADIWVPEFRGNGSAALDFAVTSGLRTDALQASALDARQCVGNYESAKRLYLDTAAQCTEQGIQFIPMVVEGHGGSWGPAAKDTWKPLAKEYANCNGI